MKSLLQMCAMTTLKYDPQLKEYYIKKNRCGCKENTILKLHVGYLVPKEKKDPTANGSLVDPMSQYYVKYSSVLYKWTSSQNSGHSNPPHNPMEER